MRIGVLNNLRAGRNRKCVAELLHFLKDHPEVAHVETSSARAVPDALWELARQDVELLVVNGGDGTLQHTLTELLVVTRVGDELLDAPVEFPVLLPQHAHLVLDERHGAPDGVRHLQGRDQVAVNEG